MEEMALKQLEMNEVVVYLGCHNEGVRKSIYISGSAESDHYLKKVTSPEVQKR